MFCASAGAHRLTPRYFACVADETVMAYRVYLEAAEGDGWDVRPLADAIDRQLGVVNVEYQGKRASGRLHALTMARLAPGTGQAVKTACVRGGQREGQFKPTVLQYRRELPLSLDEHVA